jgi:hypothetical protein
VLVDELSQEKATRKGEYRLVRSAFARYFETKYADRIKEAFGDDHPVLTTWLDANPEAKETLFTAIDPDTDDVVKALEVFRDLYKLGPDKLKAYANVAVAVAVVWDDPKAVYDYRGHQLRTKSHLPDGVMKVGAVENYEALTRIDGPVKAAVQFFPWEFLIHVINHRTPEDERAWAAKTYLKRRAGIGASYKDVEYDVEMLRTQSEVCRLNDKPYTLPSIRQHGGVCAMQADFAARVAKSLVVPAEYVGGEGQSGGLHAWVMWVEVRSVQKDKIDFVLMSEGRYLLDQYYVGTLKDPKSGKKMTDRDLERRLTFVGAAPQNARHADLLMRAYPLYRERKNLTPAQQVAYLRKVLEIFPSAERAWLALAELYREGTTADHSTAVSTVNRAFTTFARFPDFFWAIQDDLITAVKDRLVRTSLYEKSVLSFEALGRPDLACEARLKLVDYQVEAKEYKKAADGLAQTVRKFPAEGRYVPKMMDRLEEVCRLMKGKTGTDLLARFYLEVLPKVPRKRGSEPSQYCIKLYEKAVAFFKENNRPREAALLEQQLALIAQGRG